MAEIRRERSRPQRESRQASVLSMKERKPPRHTGRQESSEAFLLLAPLASWGFVFSSDSRPILVRAPLRGGAGAQPLERREDSAMRWAMRNAISSDWR